MRQFRFITERHNLTIGSSVLLTDEEASHAHRALRLTKGDEVFLFNGEREYKAILTKVSKEAVMAEITEEVTDQRPDRNLIMTIYIGMPKIKHFETVLEKATELGVFRIVPVITEYSIIKAEDLPKKYDRWQKIVETACKQSERIDIPKITEPMLFEDAVNHAKENNEISYFFTLDRTQNNFGKISQTKTKHKNIGIFIGPEGGFSPSEITKVSNIDNIKLNVLFDEVLRTETAAISAISIVRFIEENI